MLPAPLSLDKWGVLALEAQAELKRHARTDEEGEPRYSDALYKAMELTTPMR